MPLKSVRTDNVPLLGNVVPDLVAGLIHSEAVIGLDISSPKRAAKALVLHARFKLNENISIFSLPKTNCTQSKMDIKDYGGLIDSCHSAVF